MSAKILGVIVFVLVPSVAFAQYGRETVARLNELGCSSQPTWAVAGERR